MTCAASAQIRWQQRLYVAAHDMRSRRATVVVLRVTEAHGVRRQLHPRREGCEQLLFREDEVGPVVVGQFVLVAHRQRTGRARLDAQATQDAAQVVDLVDATVTLAW